MKKEKWSKRHSGGFRKWLITVLLAISVLMTGYSVLKEAGDVLLHHAPFGAESTPNKGTCFWFMLEAYDEK